MIKTLIIAAVCAISLTAGIMLSRNSTTSELPEGTVLYNQPRALGEFTLEDKNGAEFTPAQLKGRWSLVYFGFTHCPDVCPGSLAKMKRIRALIADTHPALQYILVTVDPERDTSQRLKDYVEFFDESFQAVTGTPNKIDAFIRRFGVASVKVEDDAMPGGYTVDHTSVFALVNTNGNIIGVFTSPHKVENVVAGIDAARKRFDG